MRYISKQIFDSMQFFCAVAGERRTYENYIKYLIYGLECNTTKEQSIQEEFELDVDRWFKNNILYGDNVKKILFDDDGIINNLTIQLYENLQVYGNKYRLYQDCLFDIVDEYASVIKESEFSKDITELARLRLHDAEIFSIELQENELRIQINYFDCRVYKFHVVDKTPFTDLEKYVGSVILYEEIFMNDDKTFEYNILTTTNDIQNHIQDLSIQFYDVQIIE